MKAMRIFFIVIFFLLFSCEKSNDSVLFTLYGRYGINYHESIRKWEKLKKMNGNSYVYRTMFTSTELSYSNETELRVENGTVISRKYKEYNLRTLSNPVVIIYSYSETKVDLGSHQKGAKLLTIDDLYNTCASKYIIVDDKNNTIIFDTNEDGIMTDCGFIPDGCMDDCYRGISIEFLYWVK